MKVLITGARGMLGAALAKTWADTTPTLWDKAEIDITNAAEVDQKITELAPELIINAAAYTNVDQAETERGAAFAVNEQGVRNIAAAALKIEATLVHYSTDYVFPGTKDTGYDEYDTAGPAVNAYGESKLAGEQALQEISPRFYLLRTAWLYGSGGKNFVDTMITLAQTKSEVRVVNDQQGSPTYTHDVAQTTRQLVEGFEPDIYHVINGGQTTWFELARTIFKLKGLSVKVVPVSSDEYPRPAKRPKYSMLKNTKGPLLRPWEEALDDYLENYHS